MGEIPTCKCQYFVLFGDLTAKSHSFNVFYSIFFFFGNNMLPRLKYLNYKLNNHSVNTPL